MNALASVICTSIRRPVAELASITKLAEGGFNRILQATFNDQQKVLARIPFRTTTPVHYAVASEAATLHFLRQHGVRVPKVLGYSASASNPVGAEYLLLEKLEGKPLAEQWFSMETKPLTNVMKQIVETEKQFMTIPLPASGSLYFRRDLKRSESFVALPNSSLDDDQVVIGPTAQYTWWYEERALLKVDRGPCKFL